MISFVSYIISKRKLMLTIISTEKVTIGKKRTHNGTINNTKVKVE